MHNSKPFSVYQSLLILCLLATATCGCNALRARASQARGPQESKERFTGRGIRITEVYQGSPAEHAGLQPMDVIFRYGDFEILDDSSFFTARDTYENGRQREVQLIIWRAGKALPVTMPPGRLGIQSNEYSPVAYQLSSLWMKLDAQQQIPEYQRDREFKDAYTPPEKIFAEAKTIIDQAEREGTLTPTQILVARIYSIPDDASPEDLKRQSELLVQLISTQPASFLHMLGSDRLFANKHYRPAVACLKRHLEVDPDDVAMRLNLGVAYYNLGMYSEAEAAADYVLDHELELGDHGYRVAYQVKAMGTLSRGDYAKTISVSEQALELEPNSFDVSRLMLAAAQTGDVQKLTEASSKFKRVRPDQFEKKKLQFVAVEALALVKSNQRDRARELARAWQDTDRIEGRLKSFWKVYPGGSDVWTNWNDLTRN